MPRPPNTEQRRDQIVAGLARVLADQGYAKATVQSIARAAGLTPGLLHYHFRNKQEILIALAERLASRLRSRVEQEIADPLERLLAAIDGLVDTERGLDGEAMACWVVIGAEAARQPEVRVVYEASIRALVDVFADDFGAAMEDAGRSAVTARTAALSVVAAVEGFFRLAAGAPACVPPGHAAAAIRRITLGHLSEAIDARP